VQERNEMEKIDDNEKERILKKKAEFYYFMNLKCHIKLKTLGFFINGKILSTFNESGGFWIVKDDRKEEIKRVFLEEIFDIEDYQENIGKRW